LRRLNVVALFKVIEEALLSLKYSDHALILQAIKMLTKMRIPVKAATVKSVGEVMQETMTLSGSSSWT